MDRKLMLTLMVLCFILSASCVFAQTNDTNVTQAPADDEILQINTTGLMPDVPDLTSNDTFYVNSNNVNTYFPDNALDEKYENSTLIMEGEFEDVGVLKIESDHVTVNAGGAHLKNTAFDISGNNVTLKNIRMDLDTSFEETGGAAIYVSSSDVDLINVYVNYIVPYNVDAYVILGEANSKHPSRNLRIINSTFYFEAHNDEVKKYNSAVKLLNFHDSIMENTTLTGSFPLNQIDYGVDGAHLDNIYVYTLGIEGCDNFILRGNQIISDVNKRPAWQYPTLDGVILSRSNNVWMYNNSIYMTDFVTNPGVENYLYGINVHSLTNLTIDSNRISMITTGGKLAMGTAYPIQINGPIMGVVVTNNDLYSFSNGPNIGIYSVNYFGRTSLLIANNTINVTGLAGVHDWALVTGIESQDSNAEIINNKIEVHSVGDVKIGDNLYAISYRQATSGVHTFNIQNNTAFTDGYEAIHLLSSYNSTIKGNTLISFNDNAQTGSDAYGRGSFSHVNDDADGNRVINIRDYLATLNNVDGANDDSSRPSGEETSRVDGGGYSSQPTNQYDYNPLIPGYFDTHGIADKEASSDLTGLDDGTATQINDYASGKDSKSDETSENNDNTEEFSGEVVSAPEQRENSGVSAVSNSTQATPDITGDNGPIGGYQSGQSNQPSASKKAFEIQEAMKNKTDLVPSFIIAIFALILLIIGYRRKDSTLE